MVCLIEPPWFLSGDKNKQSSACGSPSITRLLHEVLTWTTSRYSPIRAPGAGA
jgi:hypothetical protein